jgi:peptidyl-dipeptidase Dcp
LSEFGNDITLNADLFIKSKSYLRTKKQESNPEKATLLDKNTKVSQKRCQFAKTKKIILREIDKELSKTVLSLVKMFCGNSRVPIAYYQ